MEGGAEVRTVLTEIGKVKSSRVATETEGSLVIGRGGLLSGVEGPKPKASAVAGKSNLGHPLAPVTLSHTTEELQRLWRRGSGVLHGSWPWAKEALSLRQRRRQALEVIKQNRILHLTLLLEMEFGLDLLNLIRAQMSDPDR